MVEAIHLGGHRISSPADVFDLVGKSGAVDWLGPLYDSLSAAVVANPAVASVLQGRGLGHPLHPALTDLPLGLWASTSLLDVFGGKQSRRAATLLCATGVATAVPTAAAGLADYQSMTGYDRRLGIAHAAGNSAGVLMYAASSWSRMRGRHFRATLQALAGAASVIGAGYLGGHLALAPAADGG